MSRIGGALRRSPFGALAILLLCMFGAGCHVGGTDVRPVSSEAQTTTVIKDWRAQWDKDSSRLTTEINLISADAAANADDAAVQNECSQLADEIAGLLVRYDDKDTVVTMLKLIQRGAVSCSDGDFSQAGSYWESAAQAGEDIG